MLVILGSKDRVVKINIENANFMHLINYTFNYRAYYSWKLL